jgi:hypothetical protein
MKAKIRDFVNNFSPFWGKKLKIKQNKQNNSKKKKQKIIKYCLTERKSNGTVNNRK